MSPRWLPGTAAAIPAASDSSVTRSSRVVSPSIAPTGTVVAESVK
jgi:hypothetical protein